MPGRQKRGRFNPGPTPPDVQRAERIGEPVSETNPRQKGIKHTPEWEAEFLRRVRATGAGPKVVCEAADMPDARTVYSWLAEDAAFGDRYAAAKLAGITHRYPDEIIEIADDKSQDVTMRLGYKGPDPQPEPNGEFMRRSHMRIEARKWILAKLVPRKFGDRVTQEVTGENGGPIKILSSTVKFVDP